MWWRRAVRLTLLVLVSWMSSTFFSGCGPMLAAAAAPENATVLPVPPWQIDALIDIYNNTRGQYWLRNCEWENGIATYQQAQATGATPEQAAMLVQPCTWFGVVCDPLNQTMVCNDTSSGSAFHQISQRLTQQTDSSEGFSNSSSLGDATAVSFSCVSGSNPTSGGGPMEPLVAALAARKAFHVASDVAGPNTTYASVIGLILLSNNLYGTLPDSIANLSDLATLLVDQNDLYGEVPATLASLQNLTVVDLHNNSLTGGGEAALQLRNLIYLDMSFNNLGLDINDAVAMPNLTVFACVSCNAMGTLANITQFPALSYLYLASNSLTGSLPSDWGALPLTHVLINDNRIEGPVPSFAGLSRLQFFLAYDNRLSGTLDNTLSDAQCLNWLMLGNNNLQGTVPKLPSALSIASLYSNKFTGPLPELSDEGFCVFARDTNASTHHPVAETQCFLGNALSVFDMSNNKLSKSMDPEFFNRASSLETVALTSNCITGTIPDSLCRPQNLSTIIFDGLHGARHCGNSRRVHGTLPNCTFTNMNLTHLLASSNNLRGTIPSDAFNSSSRNLVQLDLSSNVLDGTIPKALLTHPRLSKLKLGSNRFSGTLNTFPASTTAGTFSVSLNHLSCRAPSIPNSLELPADMNLNMLVGNIWHCGIPHQIKGTDRHGASYTCGSRIVRISLTVLGTVGLAWLILSYFLRRKIKNDILGTQTGPSNAKKPMSPAHPPTAFTSPSSGQLLSSSPRVVFWWIPAVSSRAQAQHESTASSSGDREGSDDTGRDCHSSGTQHARGRHTNDGIESSQLPSSVSDHLDMSSSAVFAEARTSSVHSWSQVFGQTADEDHLGDRYQAYWALVGRSRAHTEDSDSSQLATDCQDVTAGQPNPAAATRSQSSAVANTQSIGWQSQPLLRDTSVNSEESVQRSRGGQSTKSLKARQRQKSAIQRLSRLGGVLSDDLVAALRASEEPRYSEDNESVSLRQPNTPLPVSQLRGRQPPPVQAPQTSGVEGAFGGGADANTASCAEPSVAESTATPPQALLHVPVHADNVGAVYFCVLRLRTTRMLMCMAAMAALYFGLIFVFSESVYDCQYLWVATASYTTQSGILPFLLVGLLVCIFVWAVWVYRHRDALSFHADGLNRAAEPGSARESFASARAAGFRIQSSSVTEERKDSENDAEHKQQAPPPRFPWLASSSTGQSSTRQQRNLWWFRMRTRSTLWWRWLWYIAASCLFPVVVAAGLQVAYLTFMLHHTNRHLVSIVQHAYVFLESVILLVYFWFVPKFARFIRLRVPRAASFSVKCFVAITISVLLPIAVTALLDPRCLYPLIVGEGTSSGTVTVEGCMLATERLCKLPVSRLYPQNAEVVLSHTVSYTPVFTYNYECSWAVLHFFTPVFIMRPVYSTFALHMIYVLASMVRNRKVVKWLLIFTPAILWPCPEVLLDPDAEPGAGTEVAETAAADAKGAGAASVVDDAFVDGNHNDAASSAAAAVAAAAAAAAAERMDVSMIKPPFPLTGISDNIDFFGLNEEDVLDVEKVYASVVVSITVLLTFGLASPYCAVAIALGECADTVFWLSAVGRFQRRARSDDRQLLEWVVDSIHGYPLAVSIFTIVIACLFWLLLFFDLAGQNDKWIGEGAHAALSLCLLCSLLVAGLVLTWRRPEAWMRLQTALSNAVRTTAEATASATTSHAGGDDHASYVPPMSESTCGSRSSLNRPSIVELRPSNHSMGTDPTTSPAATSDGSVSDDVYNDMVLQHQQAVSLQQTGVEEATL